jgi:hypothetical protein
VLGFLFLGASKIYFDLRIKQKRRELRSSLGSMLGLNQKLGKRASVIPLGSQAKQKPHSYLVWGFFMAQLQADGFEGV